MRISPLSGQVSITGCPAHHEGMGALVRKAPVAMAMVTAVSFLAACSTNHRTQAHTPPTAPVTTTSLSPSSTTTAPAAGGAPVGPGGFKAISVSFVSARTGWVLGGGPCPDPSCAPTYRTDTRLYRTDDGGRTWQAVNAPPAQLADHGSGEAVRFANLSDGWVSLPEVWATHDGGAHWARQPFENAYALETAGGFVHVVTSGPGGYKFRILTSPVHSDAWHSSGADVESGAGPVPQAQLVLHGNQGWILFINRGTLSGARLQGGRWVPWKTPCIDGSPGVLAASTDRNLVAHCAEGVWNDKPPQDLVFVSSDGGVVFHQVSTPLPVGFGGDIGTATPTTWVLAAFDGDSRPQLFRTADAGRTWKAVYHGDGSAGLTDLGFTTPQQGVVISEGEGQSGRLFMTYDGGETWSPVSIP